MTIYMTPSIIGFMPGQSKVGVPFRFNSEEFSGAFGDSVTVIPLLVGVALVTDASLGHMFLFFGIFQIATGLFYRLPMPVEPMKALSALVIAGVLTYGDILFAGFILGLVFLTIGTMGVMKKVDKAVPSSVVRGIQMGLALIFLRSALGYSLTSPWLALLGIGVVLFFVLMNIKWSVPNVSALLVILIGVVYGIYTYGSPPLGLISIPIPALPIPDSLVDSLVQGTLPQFFLTAGNSILATSLLFSDLLHQKVDPDDLTRSVGVMNVVSPLFGGMPMCHGSGGLAGQYRFGARTGGSNLILGTIYIGVALVANSPEALAFFPLAVLGALLVFIAIELGLAGSKTKIWSVTLITAILALITNIAVGFLAGFALFKVRELLKK